MRLVTRGDFDGLICALLLSEVESVDRVYLGHADDIGDKRIRIEPGDIIANLPFHPDAAMWFDHHSSETPSIDINSYKGKFEIASSCARVVYNYYGKDAFPGEYAALVAEADRIDDARFTPGEIENPSGWTLLSQTLQKFSAGAGLTSLHSYFNEVLKLLKTLDVEEILKRERVKERAELVLSEQESFRGALLRCCRTKENAVICDLRKLEKPVYGNRFLVYTLFPDQNISVTVFEKKQRGVAIISCGHNIFKRDSKTDIGSLMKTYGGGGHRGAGTCRVEADRVDRVLTHIVNQLIQDG